MTICFAIALATQVRFAGFVKIANCCVERYAPVERFGLHFRLEFGIEVVCLKKTPRVQRCFAVNSLWLIKY